MVIVFRLEMGHVIPVASARSWVAWPVGAVPAVTESAVYSTLVSRFLIF